MIMTWNMRLQIMNQSQLYHFVVPKNARTLIHNYIYYIFIIKGLSDNSVS